MKILVKILWVFICALIYFSDSLMASVQLEIGNGVVVETTGGIYVVINGELIESGNGYFKGKISSGERTEMTSFAGMTLNNGIDGSITRTTGSAYAKGNGEGTNFLRYYEINNSGNMVTADMQVSFASSGNFDERNSLTDPYYIYRYFTNWNGYGEGVSSSPISTAGIHLLLGLTDWLISDSNFILFIDSEVANTGTPLLFNESGEGGDGHDVEMTFSNLTGSGSVTVQQTNRAPSGLLNNGCLTYSWNISKDASITSFTTDVSFKYLESDLLDVSENILVSAYYDSAQSKWLNYQDYTLDEVNNTLTIHNLDHFTIFAVREGDDDPLPVELSSFEAEVVDNDVVLKWITESEVDNQGFEIFRSEGDENDYYLLSSYQENPDLLGHGNTNNSHEYAYVDDTIERSGTFWYKITDVGFDGTRHSHLPLKIIAELTPTPKEFELSQNYPNPFNPGTRIEFGVPDKGKKVRVKIAVYDILGRHVRNLLNTEYNPGYHYVYWDGRNDQGLQMGSGIYFYYLISQDWYKVKKMILMK